MSRARKWLLGTGIAIGVLIIALIAALFWIIHTPSGLRFALDRGVTMTHGAFQYSATSGTLAGSAHIEGLRYRSDDGTTLRVAHAVINLQPWALFARRLQVTHARIDGIELDLAPPKPSRESSTFSLQPPLTLALADTRLTHIVVRQTGHQTFAIDSLAIAGLWSSRQLLVRKLELRAPAGSASLQGTLALAKGHSGSGRANFDWSQAGTRYVGSVTSESDGKTAHLHATLSTPTTITADGSLQLDPTHAWTLALAAPRFDTQALPVLPAALKTLAVDVHGTGDAHGGKLTGSIAVNDTTLLLDPAQFRYDGDTLTLDPLRLRSPQIAGTASITGAVHLAATPMRFDLATQWRDVQIPAALAGQPLASHGDLTLRGNTAAYVLQGTLALGPPGKLADIQLDLAGTPHTIDVHALKLVQKNGGLDVHGSIALQPRAAWKLDAVATHFDPGAILAGWNGTLDFTLASAGTLTPAGPEATLKLDHASGTLRQRNIAGSQADLVVTPDNLLQGSLLLVAGHSRIHAAGQHGARTDAVVTLAIASLADWLPNASGNLSGRFTLKGAWPKLAVAGQARGDHLRVGERSIDALQLSAAIPDVSQPGGKLDLELSGVHAGGFAFDHVQLAGSGTAASHHLRLDARGAQLNVALALAGSWQARTHMWRGTLSGIELAPHGLPAWHQRQPSALTWRSGALSLSELCLSAGAPHACLSANRTASGNLAAKFSLQHLPLQMLAALAPGSHPLQASGELSGDGNLTLTANGGISGDANLNTGAGNIAYAASPQRALLAWNSVAATLRTAGSTQRLQLEAALADGGHVRGDISLSGATHALQGTLTADLRDLAFIPALSPEVANVQGSIAGALQLSGTLAAPRFGGSIQSHGFAAEIPRAGLKLHDGQFAISGDASSQLAIAGSMASGDGVLHVDGSVGLAANAPLRLAIKGDNVLVADIPAAHVVASPDLQVSRSDGVFKLTGSVAIPSADVKVEKLPGQGPARASPDVVIVDAPPSMEVTPLAMDADISVQLGDAVKVQGYGLDGTLHGQLAVRVRPGQTASGRGQINVAGTYQAYGQDLSIERGRLLFAGTRLDNPGLDIRAVRKLRSQGVSVGLSIRGTVQQPILTVFSDPPMEQAEALSWLVTGRALNTLNSGESSTLNTAAQALGGLAGDRIAKSIGERLGLDAGVSTSDALGGSAFTAGKYLSPRLYLSYGVGLFTPGQVITLRYTLNRFLQFEAENATTGNRASLNYKIEK